MPPNDMTRQKDNPDLNVATRTSAPTEDEQLLNVASPPDFTRTDTWRVFRIIGEFVEVFFLVFVLGSCL